MMSWQIVRIHSIRKETLGKFKERVRGAMHGEVRGWAAGRVRGAQEESESDWTLGEHRVCGRGAESQDLPESKLYGNHERTIPLCPTLSRPSIVYFLLVKKSRM